MFTASTQRAGLSVAARRLDTTTSVLAVGLRSPFVSLSERRITSSSWICELCAFPLLLAFAFVCFTSIGGMPCVSMSFFSFAVSSFTKCSSTAARLGSRQVARKAQSSRVSSRFLVDSTNLMSRLTHETCEAPPHEGKRSACGPLFLPCHVVSTARIMLARSSESTRPPVSSALRAATAHAAKSFSSESLKYLAFLWGSICGWLARFSYFRETIRSLVMFASEAHTSFRGSDWRVRLNCRRARDSSRSPAIPTPPW
mmetsp:Transcript_4651/g.10945  ORF Transcript_4651/g.10945 Transcript_4651/m.10945 type:complete len:256 (+) Transcript_4651:1702-2469(+)